MLAFAAFCDADTFVCSFLVEFRSIFCDFPRCKGYDAMALVVSENLLLVGISPVRQLNCAMPFGIGVRASEPLCTAVAQKCA